ncbi:MAG TPA: STAS domain-containing protein [Polyangiaceae bacterium]|nr:STAS domain-containing protein [Polyangiaceae bacterium]
MLLQQRLAVLEEIALPIWVMDTVQLRMLWANQRGLELWGSPSLDEFLARDFSTVSPSMRTRLSVIQEGLEQGRSLEEQVTLYPRGVPRTVRSRVSPLVLDDGRVLMLAQALLTSEGFDPTLVRGLEALRHLPATVAMVDAQGAVVMQNPAGVRTFGDAPLAAWFADDGVAAALLAEVAEGRVYRAEVEVRTSDGRRWHAVEARPTTDPVTGGPATLLVHFDVTPLRESLEQVARKEREIRALAAPILDVGDGVLAVPLLGTLDAPRTAALTERLLPEVVARRARAIILDLTGLDAFDLASAEALMKLTRAVALLGVRSTVSGVSPKLAEALVRSGGDLSGLRTRRTLYDALRAPAHDG